MSTKNKLLFLTSFASGYPGFDTVFDEHQLKVTKATSLRKALSLIKQTVPDYILAEFVFAPTYGSQLSNFESLFAAAQTGSPNATFIAMVHKDDLHHFERVKSNSFNCELLIQPVGKDSLDSLLKQLTSKNDT